MLTLGDVRDFAFRIIGNNTGEAIEPSLVLDAVGAALDAILPWHPKELQVALTGDGTTNAFNLPNGFYEVEAVILQSTGEILARANFAPGNYYGANIAATNSWILLPSGQISFAKIPEDDQVLTLLYTACWPKPTDPNNDAFVLEPADHYRTALALYTAAYLIMPDLVGIASIASYKTRIDSGTPEDNPIIRAFTFLMNLFNQEMNRHPKHQRSQT